MKCSSIILFALSVAVRDAQGKVDLKKGRTERVSIDGDKLVIVVDNSAGNFGDLLICFAASPTASYRTCPLGFTGATIQTRAKENVRVTVNRQGQFSDSILRTWEDIEFNEDNTLNITIAELPDARTIVTLENAEIFVPVKPKEEQVVTPKKFNAFITVIAVVVVLLLIGVIISILVWFCVIRKPELKQIIEWDDQDHSPEPCERGSTPQNLSAKMPDKCPSNTRTPPTIQTTVNAKRIAHPSPGMNARSPSMAQPLKVTTSTSRSPFTNARVPLADYNMVINQNI